MFVALLAAGALLADATPAASAAAQLAASPAAAPPAEAAKKPEKPKLVCHSVSTTGSLFPTKVCVNPKDAADRRQQDRDALEKMQQQIPMRGN